MRQIASFDELPKEKRPPEIYWDHPDLLDDWFDKVFKKKKSPSKGFEYVNLDEIE